MTIRGLDTEIQHYLDRGWTPTVLVRDENGRLFHADYDTEGDEKKVFVLAAGKPYEPEPQ